MNHRFRTLIFCILFLLFFNAYSQNLVINPSFENIVSCPDAFMQIENSLSWTSPTAAKADYFHACDLSNTVGIPANSVGFQSARTGSAYAGVQVYSTTANTDYREYLQSPLIEPLIADSVYQVSMYVSPADNLDDCFTDAIGFYFSDMELNEPQQTVLNITADVQNISDNFLTDKGNWLLVTGVFTATGGENYLIIGNFLNDAQTTEATPCDNDAAAYYYVDDVSVELIPELSIVGQNIICAGETTVLQAVNGQSYEWTIITDPDTVFSTEEFVSVSPNQTTTYRVSDGVNTATFTLTVQQAPEINLTDDVSFCEGETIVLDANPLNSSETSTFNWIDGSTIPTFEAETTGIYWVDVTTNGCTIRDSIELFFGNDFEVNLGENQVFCEGTSSTLSPFEGDILIPNLTYLWQDGSTNPQFTATSTGTYSVTVSNECFAHSDVIEVTTLLCGCIVSFPSAFSPNEDGINDTFRPASNCNLTNYELSIYTRYGNKIFTSTDQTEGWDGLIDFEVADMKVYVWVATYQTPDGMNETSQTVVQKGNVFLLR
ncbi:MAG: gliding motility-associated C-terminal domain-containing protein [Chitinophagales bacterium]